MKWGGNIPGRSFCVAAGLALLAGFTGCPAPKPVTLSFSAVPASGPAPLAVAFQGNAEAVAPYHFKFRDITPPPTPEEPDTEITIRAWRWNYGDGSTGTGQTSQHTYQEPGRYDVTLTVELSNNAVVAKRENERVIVTGEGEEGEGEGEEGEGEGEEGEGEGEEGEGEGEEGEGEGEVENTPPVARAGLDRPVYVTGAVTLDGSGSSDADNDDLTYAWSLTAPEGSAAQLDGAATAAPSFAADVAGAFVAQLVVYDGQAYSAPDEVTITAVANRPPEVNVAQSEYVVVAGETLEIEVTGTDPDGDAVVLSASPFVDDAEFDATAGTEASGTWQFEPAGNAAASYTLAFSARDPLGLTDQTHVLVVVTPVNHPPVVAAPENVSVDEGQIVGIRVTATDPDGDIPTLSAAPLPPNALFVPATGSLSFAPDYEQAGEYDVVCVANDGSLDSEPRTIHVTVNDITAGQESRLELVVDDVESPTLLRKTRVTGTVNPTGELPPPQRITSGLITGMDPTAGEQGETLDVVLTGDSSGPWPVHFAAGVSAAQFGQGIQVDSVDVASPTSLTAHIRIAGDAAPGARVVQVQTGAETAVCAPVFLVTPGRAHLTGLVTDPESGEPLVGALVSVQGTNISAVTDSEGRYTLRDLPPGRLRLVVNAPNHELFAFEADARVGETVDVGPVQPRTLVFDPNTPPGVSLFSVIAREATPYKSNRDLDDLRQMIIDTMLLLSDGEVGVLDAYGNQLNAGVEGRGAMSLNDEGIDRIARMLQSGKTYTLVQLVQGVSLGFEWGGDGEIMTWPEWREALQTMVDTAWEDPGNPENYPILVTFNQGNQFLFEPPVISEATRLNFFQAFLFTSSLFGSMEVPGEKSIGGVKFSNYNKYWRGFYGVRSSWPLLKVNEIAARYLFAVGFAQTIAVATPGILGALTGTIVLGSMVPDLALAISTAGSLIQVPEPPRIVGAGKNVLGEVGVTFKRSQTEISDPDAAANFSWIYTLVRFDSVGGPPHYCSSANVLPLVSAMVPGDPNGPLTLVDPKPPKVGSVYYAATVTRRPLFSGDEIDGVVLPWWGFVHGEFSDYYLWERKRNLGLTSDFSDPYIYHVEDLPQVPVDAVAVSDISGFTYISFPENGNIYVADLRSTGTVDTRIYTNAGFKAPGQKGLAINSDYDSLYTDNSGSDAMYGGRIFELSDKKKQHVGSANYYSRDLSFAHPCSVMSLVKGHKDWTENFGKQLFLWDDLAREVKVLSLTYPEGADTFHNVAHRFFSFADAEVGAAIDMDVDKLEEGKVQIVYVLHSGGIIEITRSYNDLAGEWKVTSQTLMY